MLSNPAQTRAIYFLTFATLTASVCALGIHAQLRHSRSAAIPGECLNWSRYVDLPAYRRAACEAMIEGRNAFTGNADAQ